MKQAPPVPVDIFVAQKTRVLVITGPNTGGKTICLKTLGLAAMMAKSGWLSYFLLPNSFYSQTRILILKTGVINKISYFLYLRFDI